METEIEEYKQALIQVLSPEHYIIEVDWYKTYVYKSQTPAHIIVRYSIGNKRLDKSKLYIIDGNLVYYPNLFRPEFKQSLNKTTI